MRRSTRFATFAFALAAASTGFFLYACGGGDDSSGTTPGNDSGSGVDATTLDGATPDGGALPDGSTPPADGSTPTDGGTKSDGGVTPPISTCSAPVRVDSLGKVLPDIVGVSFGGKYAFFWTQNASLTGDGSDHERSRYFNGTSWATEVDLGKTETQASYAAVDPTGKAYIVRNQAPGPILGRDVYDLTTGALAIPTSPTPFKQSDITSFGVGALPSGAVALYQAPTGKLEIADVYTPTKGWSNGGDAGVDAGAPIPLTNNAADVARVALNAMGKGALVSVEDGPSGSNLIHVTPFDGTKLGITIDRNVTTGAAILGAAALSNGDVALAWIGSEGSATPNVTFAQVHPTAAPGSQWDPDVTVGAWVLGGGGPLVFADPHDNVTVLWVVDGSHVVAKKRIGTTWSAQIPVGPAISAVGTLDPNGNVVAVTVDTSHNAQITRMAEDATTFGALVPTTLPTTNNGTVAFAFDAAGDPVLAVWGSHSGDTQLWATTCAH